MCKFLQELVENVVVVVLLLMLLLHVAAAVAAPAQHLWGVASASVNK